MGDLIFEIFCYGIGRVYLFFRYRNKEKRQEILQKEYDNSYSDVGRIKVAQAFVFPLLILIIAGIIIAILSIL